MLSLVLASEKEKVLVLYIIIGMVRVNGAPIELVSPAPLR